MRKFITLIFLITTILSCQNYSEKNSFLGSYNVCSKDGTYSEFKITDKYVLRLSTKSDEIVLFRSKVVDNRLIISLILDRPERHERFERSDTLTVIKQSKDKIILKSANNWEESEFNKAEFQIDKIDSTNLDSWKIKTLTHFKERAKLKNCPDLRTEKEKVDSVLHVNDELNEDLIIIRTDSIN